MTPSSASPATGSPACPNGADVARKQSADPLGMSGLVGGDIRTGRHECFERIVIELGGSGTFPGWFAEYRNDPVQLGESNETAFIRGDATLVVRLGSWMRDTTGEGYQGPHDVFPTNVSSLRELRLIENHEGVTIWAIGIDRQRPFDVSVLPSPPRLVIDVQTGT
ncbi:MAG: hypothetical protein ABIQ39_01100 [Ilumatobacteraceae bacterium]